MYVELIDTHWEVPINIREGLVVLEMCYRQPHCLKWVKQGNSYMYVLESEWANNAMPCFSIRGVFR